MIPKIIIGDLVVNWYFVLIYIALFIASFFILTYKNRPATFNNAERLIAILVFYIFSIWGGKLFSGIETYFVNLKELGYASFNLKSDLIQQDAGRLYGSLALNLLFGSLLFFIWDKQKVLRAFDIASLAICLGISIGKIGCFLDGHFGCYGIFTELPWGVTFPYGEGKTEFPVHPIQVYDAIFHILFWVFLLKADKRIKINGLIGGFFVIGTSFYNFFIEFIRTSESVLGVFSLAQIVYPILILLILILFYFTENTKRLKNSEKLILDKNST